MTAHKPTRPWVVLKYGGTSVASPKTWEVILERVRELLPRNRVWIVVSALSQVTNRLLKSLDDVMELAEDASRPISPFSSTPLPGAGPDSSSASPSNALELPIHLRQWRWIRR